MNSVEYKEKAFTWFKLVSITGGAQLIVQIVGFVSGILVIRLLPTNEYGLYTLANTMLGAITILADGGISTGVMAQGGKVWQDKNKLGAVLATGLDLRKKFAAGSLLISSPVLIYLLIHHGASWLTSLLIVVSLIPAFYAGLSDSLLEIVPKLHQSILPLQKNQVNVGVARLLLIGLTLFIFPWTFIALLASGIPRIYGNIRLRKISHDYIDESQQPDPQVRKEILAIVKRVLPGAFYFCISGQITVWLISIFGNTTAVAQVGALSRLTMLLSLFSALSNTLIVPRFVRLPPHKKSLLKYVFGTLAAISLISFVLVLFTALFPKQILFILGDAYMNLSRAMILSVLTGCISLLVGIFISFSSSRGWIMNPVLLMLFNIFGTIFPLFFINIATLEGVILLSLMSSIWGLLVNGGYMMLKIFRLQEQSTL